MGVGGGLGVQAAVLCLSLPSASLRLPLPAPPQVDGGVGLARGDAQGSELAVSGLEGGGWGWAEMRGLCQGREAGRRVHPSCVLCTAKGGSTVRASIGQDGQHRQIRVMACCAQQALQAHLRCPEARTSCTLGAGLKSAWNMQWPVPEARSTSGAPGMWTPACSAHHHV